MRVVVDTNVFVSGLLSPHGPPGRILDGILSGELTILVDDRILDEYRTVLARPRFRFPKADVTDLLLYLVSASKYIPAQPIAGSFPDPHDACFVEVASAGHADALITGNRRHFPPELTGRLSVMSPRDFVDHWSKPI